MSVGLISFGFLLCSTQPLKSIFILFAKFEKVFSHCFLKYFHSSSSFFHILLFLRLNTNISRYFIIILRSPWALFSFSKILFSLTLWFRLEVFIPPSGHPFSLCLSLLCLCVSNLSYSIFLFQFSAELLLYQLFLAVNISILLHFRDSPRCFMVHRYRSDFKSHLRTFQNSGLHHLRLSIYHVSFLLRVKNFLDFWYGWCVFNRIRETLFWAISYHGSEESWIDFPLNDMIHCRSSL